MAVFSGMRYFLLFILLPLLMACNQSQSGKIDANRPDFSTTHDTQMFFANVRQLYYDRENAAGGKLEVFRFKKRVKNSLKPLLNLAIANNKRYDEAYLLIEPNAAFPQSKQVEVFWENADKTLKGSYTYERGNKEAQFTFATQLYNSLKQGHQLFIKVDGEAKALLDKQEERKAFRVTMEDFYRLVGLYF